MADSVWQHGATDGFRIGVNPVRWQGIGLLIANCVMVPFTLRHLQDRDPLVSWFFLFVQLLSAADALVRIFGHVVVSKTGAEGRIFIGIGDVGWSRSFRWEAVEAIENTRGNP